MTPTTVRHYGLAIATAKIGTGLFFLINTWLMIEITGHAASGAVALAITAVPGIVCAPFLGVLVDRSRPARLAVVAELLRGGVLVVYACLYKLGLATAAVGYGVGFCVALGNELQVLCWRAAIGRGAAPEQMFRLNALTVAGGQTGQVVGAAASGFALALFGGAATVLLAAATFLVSAVFGLLVARRLDVLEPAPASRARGLRPWLADLGAGLRHIAQRPQIAFFYLLILANLTVIFGINGLLAPFVREELGLGPEAFGKIDAGYALGAIAGGLAVVRLSQRFGQRRVLLAAFLLAAASLWAFAHGTGLALPFLAYMGLGLSFQSSVISLSAAQLAADPAFQGRVNASFGLLNGLVGLAVYALIAWCSSQHLFRAFYAAQAVTMLAVFGVVLVSTRRERIRRLLRPAMRAM